MTNPEKVYIYIVLAVIAAILAIFTVVNLDMLGNIERAAEKMEQRLDACVSNFETGFGD